MIKAMLRTLGVEITRRATGLSERVVSLHPVGESQGNILLSYLIKPFLLKPGEPLPNSHTNYWRCVQIARTFLDLGYSVDVIDSRNKTFNPKKQYSFFIGHRINFDRIAGLLNGDCIKIAHLDTAHWIFNNHSTYRRKLELQQRKGITLKGSHRIVEHNLAFECADYVTMCGNDFTLSTFRCPSKPVYRLPQSPPVVYPWPEAKDYGNCRFNFLWYGSGGFVHKGLDLVLEAFVEMPDCHLYVCGPLQSEEEFVTAYHKELYQTPNIHAVGWVDVQGSEFIEIANKCVGSIFPSCAEGQAGSVIICQHAGMIPVVSRESGIDAGDFGVVLKDNAIATIKDTVRMVSSLPAEQLRQMARKSWEFVRANHTREKFAEEYKRIILDVMKSERPGMWKSGAGK